MTQDVITTIDGRIGRIRLNRPKALHALNTDMCLAMSAALDRWRGDLAVEAVLIDHAAGRGFCAGGDIRMVAESARGDGVEARRFFFEEYRMNNALFTSAKPGVAFIDEIGRASRRGGGGHYGLHPV